MSVQPVFRYLCSNCGKQSSKRPCNKESKTLGTWPRCSCGNRKVTREKFKGDK